MLVSFPFTGKGKNEIIRLLDKTDKGMCMNLQTPIIYHSDFILRCVKILVAVNIIKLQVNTASNVITT